MIGSAPLSVDDNFLYKVSFDALKANTEFGRTCCVGPKQTVHEESIESSGSQTLVTQELGNRLSLLAKVKPIR